MFRRYLSREIDQWTRKGLLQPGQGEVLLADHDQRHTGFHLSGVLAVLAAVLFGAAVVALVAANWEAIARPVRVGMVFVFIIGGLAAAAVAQRRESRWVPEAALVFVLLCYGAGIALVAQMYHLSGDEAAFMLTWTIGALVVSACFSSGGAAIAAGLLGLGYLFARIDLFGVGDLADMMDVTGYGLVLLVALAVGLSAWRSGSKMAGHLTVFILIGWILWLADGVAELDPGYVLAPIGVIAFIAGSLTPSPWSGIVVRHGTVSAYGAVMALAGLGLIQADLYDTGLAAEMIFAAFILVVSVAVLATAGGENRLIRRFAYFAFACETLYIVGETLGSLLGSAGFLFLAGLVLAIIAYAVMKIEKRFKVGESRS